MNTCGQKLNEKQREKETEKFVIIF